MGKHCFTQVLLLLFFLFSSWQARSQCSTVLNGRIVEEETGEAVGFAYVLLEGSNKGVQADETGYFSITGLCKDKVYSVDISLVGYQQLHKKIILTSDKPVTFKLKNGAQIKEIVILEQAVLTPSDPVEVKVANQDFNAGMGAGWSELLWRLPGVSQTTTGPTIVKPVIQGLHSSRVALVNNNVVHESQSWGEDHSPEIDPATADALTVVKGATGVRYGIGAIGGALILEPSPLRHEAGLGGWVAASGATNGHRVSLSSAMDWYVPRRQLGTRASYSYRRSGNLRTPDYFLDNTGLQEHNFGLLTGWRRNRWAHEIALSSINQHFGMVRAAFVGNLSDLQAALASNRPINNADAFSFAISRPRQEVGHHLGKYRFTLNLKDNWKLTGQYAFQFNDRNEYDEGAPLKDPSDSLDKPQLSMRLFTNQLDLSAEHFTMRSMKGGGGLQLFQQTNLISEGSFIPDYQTLGFAFWIVEKWRNPDSRWAFDIGLRNDFRRSHVRNIFGIRDVDRILIFNNVSGAVGMDYAFNNNFKASIHSGYAWRPPNMIELYALGVHYSAATFEEGDPFLRSEKALNTNVTLQWRNPNVNWYVNFYRNQIWDYIYLNPQNKLIQTIRGAYLAYHYTQNDAVIQGLDASIEVLPINRLSLCTKISLLEGFRTNSAQGQGLDIDWLPLMPAARLLYELKWSFGKTLQNRPAANGWGSQSKAMRRKNYETDSYFRITCTTAFRQRRIPSEGLLQAAPPTYNLINADIAHVFFIKNKKLFVGLSCRNLTNRPYRDYLNFFRYFSDEPGLSISAWSRLMF